MNRIKIYLISFLAIFITACGAVEIELPIDSPKEAIALAKKDADVQKFINQWSQEFRMGFDAQYLQDRKVWLVRIFPKGDISDVELHVLIEADGTIINKYHPAV
ncbi:MAG: hypothetical protein ABIH45_06460 [Candidatus Omnitrophota bacterium]